MDKTYCDLCDEESVNLKDHAIPRNGVYFTGKACVDCIRAEEEGPQTDEWLEADSQPVPLLDQQMNARRLK